MARRINTRFVTILGGSALGVVGIIFLADKLLIKARPDQYILAAKQDMTQHDWADADKNWAKAIAISPQDPDLWTQDGYALHQLAIADPQVAAKHADLNAWQTALEIDPKNVPAMTLLLDYWRTQMQVNPTIEAFHNARDEAEKLLTLLPPNDPAVPEVTSFKYTATVQAWIAGLDTDNTVINDTAQKMQALVAANPSDAETPYYLALIDIQQGKKLVANSPDSAQPAAATALFEKPFGPKGEMTLALARQDKNALAHYHAAQLYTLLADVDHSAPDNRAKYAKLAADEMDRAVALLKPKDAQFVEISLSAAQMALASNDRLKAAAIIRGLLKQSPDPMTVVRAGSLIDDIPDLRPQAIDLLQSALDAAGGSAPLDARRYAELGALTDLQISQMTSTDSDEARASLKDQIDKNLKRMAAFGPDPLPLITEEGRLAMVEQDYPGAIEAISNGMAASPNLANDRQLVWMLAQCYTFANERESAKEYLRKTIDSNPSFLRPRVMLIEQLAAENTDAARREMGEQIAYLQRTAPDDPDVMRLQMLEMDPVADADRIKAIYPQIPEKTVEDMLRKATVAELKLKNPDEAVRLLTAAHNADPENQITVLRLAHDQDAAGRTPDAIATIQRGLAAHPNDLTYQLGLALLQKAPADEIAKLKQKLADQRTNDPTDRDLQMAQDSLDAGNLAGAEVHLKAAEAQAPADKDIWVHLFEFYLSQKDYDKAQPYLRKLTAANYDQKHGLSYEFELAQAKGDTQRQLAIGLELTSEQPEFAASYYYLGLAYQAQGQWNQAVQNYSTAMLKKGVGQEAADMLNHEIDCYYRMNQPDKAKVAIDEGVRQFPRDTRFLYAQIQYEMTHGDAESAEKKLIDLVKANPEVPELYLQLAGARMQICQEKVKLGDMQAAGAEATAARDLLTGALAKFPDDAQMYGSLADILIAGGDRDGAEKILLQLDARPDWKGKPDPQKMLAEAYEKMARQAPAADAQASYQARAEAAYTAAIARDPKSYALRILDSEILAEHKKYDEAVKVLDGDQTGNPKIRLQRINILIAAGRIQAAEKELQAILDQHPDPDQTARLQGVYARLELADKNLSSAAEHANLALAADPQNVMALVVRARLRMAPLSPDPDGAIKDLTAARQAEPDNAEVLLAMADAYLYRFDAEQAASVLESAVRLQPQNVPLRLELVRVYSDYEPVRLDQALQVIQDGQAQPGGDSNPDLANAQASIYKMQGKPDLALQTIVTALNRKGGDLTLIRTYLQALLDNSKDDQAAKESSVVIQQDQQKIFWWAWRSRGEAKAALGDKSGAAGDLKQALAEADGQNDIPAAIEIVQTIARVVSPDMAISLVGSRRGADPRWDTCLVMLYHQHGEDDQAMQILDPMVADAAKLPPAQRVARLEMAGMIYGTAVPKPLTDKSYEMYVELLKINPINIQALNNIASLCADGFTPPKIDEGLRYIRTAQRILAARGASDANVDDTYGWLLILAGQTQQGMDILTKATSTATFPDIYYHLGEGYLRENRPTDAQVQVTNALNAIATAQQHNQTISPFLRAKVADLSNRVLDSLRPRTTGNLP